LKRALPLVVLVAGCAVTEAPRETTPPDAPGSVVTDPSKPPLAVSNARTLDEYKAEVAHAVLHANADKTFIGQLPETLKSVVVLRVSIDRNGFPYQVTTIRSNGFKELEARAIQSVRAGALPRPNGAVTGGHGYVSFMETWLFRDDGKFQIRTLAGPQ